MDGGHYCRQGLFIKEIWLRNFLFIVVAGNDGDFHGSDIIFVRLILTFLFFWRGWDLFVSGGGGFYFK